MSDAGRATNGNRRERVAEIDAFVRQAVEVGCLHERMPVRAEAVVAVLVYEDEQNIG